MTDDRIEIRLVLTNKNNAEDSISTSTNIDLDAYLFMDKQTFVSFVVRLAEQAFQMYKTHPKKCATCGHELPPVLQRNF
jgi:hypothetical protein